MAVTEAQVLDALRPVQDPELNLSIVEIGMVKDIRIAGQSVGVTIALTVPGCPLRAGTSIAERPSPSDWIACLTDSESRFRESESS